jgi:hypothetical protein
MIMSAETTEPFVTSIMIEPLTGTGSGMNNGNVALERSNVMLSAKEVEIEAGRQAKTNARQAIRTPIVASCA